jgi:predicted Zn finger-like uncharacterized protein
MKIVCDACSAKYSIADEKVRGKVFKIRCKKCSNIIVVRGSVNESAEPAAPQYDHKETKVFDYQKSGDGGNEAADGAVWHLVIDQEQVGPMTVEEVEERFRRGDVDAEGYVWREGFGDWERLADVDVFTAMVSGQRPEDNGLGGLFGSGNLDDGRGVQNDPADLFAARGAGDEAGADLFAGTGLSADAGAGDTDALFAAADGMGMGSSSAAKPASSTLTAQRNENSVLFSLNNLAALASDAPRSSSSSSSTSLSAVSSSSTSLASGSSAGPPQSEGSGLIDIRSMAQVYLGESKQSTRPVGSADDLPVFSQTSFESASPVLLPNVQPAVNNRLLIALVGLIGVLVIAAAVLVLIVLKGGGDDQPRVASVEPERAAPTSQPAASPTQPAAPNTPAAPAGGEPTTPSAAGTTPPESAPAAAGDDDDEDDKDDKARSSDRKSRDRDRDRDRRGSDRKSDRDKPAERKPDPEPAPAPDPTATSGCDEVTCLVEPDKPCCKNRRRSGSSGSKAAPVDTSLPERPSRGDVSSGVGAVKGSVSACGSRAPGGGKVTVKIKISPSGTVSSASATGGTASLNGCVESAVRRAKFPRSQLGASVNYPFIF